MKIFAAIYLLITGAFWVWISWGQPWREWKSNFIPALLWPMTIGMILLGGFHIQ
mgnify:FL=1